MCFDCSAIGKSQAIFRTKIQLYNTKIQTKMKFIKLTLNDGRSIFINPEKITDIIEKKDKTNGSFVSCGENNTADVKETAEEIVQQIESLFIEIRGVEIDTVDFDLQYLGNPERQGTDLKRFIECLDRINFPKIDFLHFDDFIVLSSTANGFSVDFIFDREEIFKEMKVRKGKELLMQQVRK